MNSPLIGIGISDRAAPGDDPAADAVTAEAVGYDAVPAAGHPVRTYPTYETQTLLTWIAARTTRIGIVPRVFGVPFRPPALVAKAAETLQRLSGGRLILGLGAGYSDVEIRAAGGPDLTPRAKADGLEDAIAIARAAWTKRTVSYHGRVYSVLDLDLEPKPDRPIPIWLGTLGPRGLALTGRVADGWIPFLRFAGPDRIPEMLDRIRTASVAAGRSADAVRAIYSVPVRLDPKARTGAGVVAGSADDVIEQLHGFAELGFTGFDLMPSRDQLRAVAEDVVPALRESLAAANPEPQPRPVTTISPAHRAEEPVQAA
jgi:alkanesulfonate monooxygenase SsuD/methylene tetrahydromethanopterin reductase-like flavin-dependent oxidoreductase (luciferase family)